MTWHAKTYGSYSTSSQEAEDNVHEMYNILTADGWSAYAIAAMLGNGAGESGLNPWRWESDDVLSINDTYEIEYSTVHGYGLFQFTPAGKYINSAYAQAFPTYGPNFSDRAGNVNDGDAQTRYMAYRIPNDWSDALFNYYYDDFISIGVDISTFYYMTFAQFKAGTGYTLDQLTGAFELKYERPGDTYAASSYSHRCSTAAYWYNVISGWGPTPPGPTPGPGKHKFKWVLFNRNRRF